MTNQASNPLRGRRFPLLARRALAATLASLLLLPGKFAAAEDFPSGPITIIVPFAPGGPDRVIRLVAQKLQEAWKQPVVVDYKPGATGLIGAAFVQRAKPDGYTLLFSGNSSMVVAPMLRTKPPFDLLTDFMPVTTVMRYPMILEVPSKHPAKDVKEFVAYTRAHPDQANFATPGAGSVAHLGTEIFVRGAGLSMTHVPFKGIGEAQTAVMAGDVQLFLDGPLSAAELIRANKVKALAVTGDKRLPGLPNTPTLAEAGFPGTSMFVWIGLFAPKGTPDPIVAKLSSELSRIIRSEEIASAISQGGLADAVGGPPQDMIDAIQKETPMFAKFVKELNVKID